MSRPSTAHERRTVPLAELEPDDVLIFPHAGADGVHAWEVWRIPYVTVPANEIRVGDHMLGRGGAWSQVLEVTSETTLTHGQDTLGRSRVLRLPTRRFRLADGSLDWERLDALCDIRRD